MIVIRKCEFCGKYRKHGEWVTVDGDIEDAIKKLQLQKVIMLLPTTCPDCKNGS